MRLILCAVVVALAGCMTPAVYRDPVSGKVDQCKATTGAMVGAVGRSEISACSAAYERMGWQKQ